MTNSRQAFTAHGRTALKIGFRQLGLQQGDRVLLPDYICEAVLHPVEQLGLVPIYYPLDRDFSPEWQALEDLASDARALIMVHYFGQPQDVSRFQKFCEGKNLFLIEDNAQGSGGQLSGNPLGFFGDIGISSPRKFLGVPSGGVLHGADESSIKSTQELPRFPIFNPRALLKSMVYQLPPLWRFLKSRMDRNKDWSDPRLHKETVVTDYRIDSLSERRFLAANWQDIAHRRRTLWMEWQEFAERQGLSPVFEQVHPESCPLAMPVYARDMEERNHWLQWGAAHSVALFPWPTLPQSVILQNGKAMERWSTLLCFPLETGPKDLGL